MNNAEITDFIGTCATKSTADIALKYGRTVSYKYALKLIKSYNIYIYESLSPNFSNPWSDCTNIKTINGQKYLHIIHSAIDYIFKL